MKAPPTKKQGNGYNWTSPRFHTMINNKEKTLAIFSLVFILVSAALTTFSLWDQQLWYAMAAFILAYVFMIWHMRKNQHSWLRSVFGGFGRLFLYTTAALLICMLIATVFDLEQVDYSQYTNEVQEYEYRYVASKESDKYHKPDCWYVQFIKEENLIEFNEIPLGYEPCEVCEGG